MKKSAFLLSIALSLSILLTACSSDNPADSFIPSPGEPSVVEILATEEVSSVYKPDHLLTMEETIQQFFEQQYTAYISLKYIDISDLLDLEQSRNRNSLVWLQNLIQRRSLLAQHQLCYVETNRYPYSITYQDQAEDDRMDFWRNRGIPADEITVHFTITGEKGQAYPPFLAVNGQHTMRLKQVGGVWKITFHYYPGSSRLRTKTPLVLLPEEEMLADLKEEFKALPSNTPANAPETIPNIPANAFPYKGSLAVEYARTYTESPNPAFYDIGDWSGNCANFTSQSLWYGFGTGKQANIAHRENMTSQWYAGQGGGSPAWENVESFWDYVTASRTHQASGLHGEITKSILGLETGGIVQTRSGRFRNSDENYNHNLLLIDKSTLLLAQNTPDSFIYYSDLADVDARYFNPVYLIK